MNCFLKIVDDDSRYHDSCPGDCIEGYPLVKFRAAAACDASIHGKKYSNSKRFPVPTLSVYHASKIAYLAQYDIYFKKWPIDERLHCEIIAVSKVLYLFRLNNLT